jgi:adenylate cyclase
MGWATVGRIGYEARFDYTAIGNVVNLASRLCSCAEDRQIVTDYSVARHLHDEIPMVDLGTRQLKGLDGQVRVYNIVGPRNERNPTAQANDSSDHEEPA